jgi:hypothetical protein
LKSISKTDYILETSERKGAKKAPFLEENPKTGKYPKPTPNTIGELTQVRFKLFSRPI